jgi:hypothetical protein
MRLIWLFRATDGDGVCSFFPYSLGGTSQSKVLAKISSDAGLMLQAHMGNVGLKNLCPDSTQYPLRKSKRTNNIIDFVHATM